MGLYDREYSREPQSGFQLSAPQTATMQLLAVTVAVYIVQVLFTGATGYLELPSDWYRRPWEVYRLLTYGFAHDQHDVKHILFNMLVLGLFGMQVEQRYGRTKFLTFYLTAVIIGGLIWSLTEALSGEAAVMVGASAAVTGVFLLFALNYPHAKVLMFFVIPMPAWVAALLCVGFDVQGAIARAGAVAFTAHLGGALFAWLFFRYGWLPGQNLISSAGSLRLRPKPRLRVVHEEDDDDEKDQLSQKVDEILQKIQEQGQDSLSWNERRLLEKASRQYQQKRK
jgi:membrane associated rhomboid family serine protease